MPNVERVESSKSISAAMEAEERDRTMLVFLLLFACGHSLSCQVMRTRRHHDPRRHLSLIDDVSSGGRRLQLSQRIISSTRCHSSLPQNFFHQGHTVRKSICSYFVVRSNNGCAKIFSFDTNEPCVYHYFVVDP